MLKNVLMVAIGGALGSVCRYLISHYTLKFSQTGFPVGTFVVNISGCLLIGIFAGYFSRPEQTTHFSPLLIAGFCGGFTTFSAFAIENLRLFQSGQTTLALVYTLSSVVLGILAAFLGFSLSQ